MKIVLCISSIWGGGAERVMSVLANHWAGRGDAVTLVTFERSASDYPLDPRIERVSLAMNDVAMGVFHAVTNNWRRLRALRSVLRRTEPSVVVSFEERMNSLVVLAAVGTGIRCVISERTDPRRHAVDVFWAALRRVTYPLAHALVVQSEAVRGWACRVALRRMRVHAIPNPVRCMRSFVRPADAPVHRTVVAVGRLVPAKGFDLLLRAFADLAQDLPQWHLVIAGQGEERSNLAALAQSLHIADRVTFSGWLDEPGEALAIADIYVLPSRYEGFPNALLEAMACGLPVVATACAGASEIVSDGVDGLLVPVESQAELGKAMRRLMEDEALCRRLGQHALVAIERYKPEVILRRWDEIIAPVPDSPRGALLQNPQK